MAGSKVRLETDIPAERVPGGETIQVAATPQLRSLRSGPIGVSFDGGGSAIAVNSTADYYVWDPLTILAVVLLADQTGSIQIDIRRIPYASYPPGAGQSITGGSIPTITTSNKAIDPSLAGWSKRLNAGDCLRYIVLSCATITRCVLELHVQRAS